VSLVVLHYTGMDSCAAAARRLCDPAAEVSAHYLIAETGEVHALVAEDKRAWHAGAGRWAGADDVNSRSIGIELANPGTCPFAAPQIGALEGLLADILRRHALPPEAVIGHSDMAPGRKVDPGARFDWRGLARAGLSVWPDDGAEDADPAGIAAALTAFGYAADLSDALRLQAFRLRFRPGVTGPMSARDAGLAADLGRRFPAAAHGNA
jgi:N-acetylmuramoyl-L-alanine amidase